MKTAVLEFQRNRVRRQPSGAASLDIIKTIAELRSALHGVGKAIEAVERLAIAQVREDAGGPGSQFRARNERTLPQPKVKAGWSPSLIRRKSPTRNTCDRTPRTLRPLISWFNVIALKMLWRWRTSAHKYEQ